jgi:hypothetical protein
MDNPWLIVYRNITIGFFLSFVVDTYMNPFYWYLLCGIHVFLVCRAGVLIYQNPEEFYELCSEMEESLLNCLNGE